MRDLGTIKLALMCERYDVDFEYSIPVKIDLFAYQLLDIIAHSNKFSGYTFIDVLGLIEIPEDLFPIYEDRLKELIKINPHLIESNNSAISLNNLIGYFNLTENGKNAVISKELPSKIERKNISLIYDRTNNKFILESKAKKADTTKSVIINIKSRLAKGQANEMIKENLENNLSSYVQNGYKAKIYDVKVTEDEDFAYQTNVQVIEDNKELKISSNNNLVLDAALNATSDEKNSIIGKMFNYPRLSNLDINIGNSIICTENILYTSCIVKDLKCVKLIEDGCGYFNYDELEYHFVGLDNKNQPLLFRYKEAYADGYPIPLCEKVRKDSDYKIIYDKCSSIIFEELSKDLDLEKLNILLGLTINKDKENVLKKALKLYKGEFREFINSLEELFIKNKNNVSFKKTIQTVILEKTKENIESEKLSLDAIFELLEKFEINKEDIFRLIKNNLENTNDVINKLIVKDEKLTTRVFELTKLYNDALALNKLSIYEHNTSMLSDFKNYANQLDSLKNIGILSYYDYKLPKDDWGPFMNEVKRTESLYNRVKLNLSVANKKGADDFFENIKDIYYELSPINVEMDESFNQTGDFFKDMERAINGKEPMFVGLAATIRFKYSEILHNLESIKDNGQKNTERLGRKLIEYVISKKDVEDVYKNWRNLCALVHSDTEKDNPIVSGDDKIKRRALMNALNIYRSKLKPLEGTDDNESH